MAKDDEDVTLYEEALRAARSGHRPKKNGGAWKLTREKILFFFGLAVFIAVFFDSQFLGHPFHFEYLLGALACCGIAIAQWGDKMGRGG